MLQELFGTSKAFIGVVHLRPLPGSPRWDGNLDGALEWARRDAKALAEGGVHGLIVENYGDVPYVPGSVGPHTVAAMVTATLGVQEEVDLPMGINVLRNDPVSAIAVAAATGCRFVRINVHHGVMAADEGVIEGKAHETLRYRRAMVAEDKVKIFADLLVKHATPLGTSDLDYLARETVERSLADLLIVSGAATGEEASLHDLEVVSGAVPGVPVLVGSGITVENAGSFLAVSDGAIVGTSLKVDGKVHNPVDAKRVAALAARFAESNRNP